MDGLLGALIELHLEERGFGTGLDVGRRMESDRGKLDIPLGFPAISSFEFMDEEEAEVTILQRNRYFLKTSRMLQFVRAEHSINPALRRRI